MERNDKAIDLDLCRGGTQDSGCDDEHCRRHGSAVVQCLTCGSNVVDALAGCCHECGAEDKHIGSQWLSMPECQRPFAWTKEQLARALHEAKKIGGPWSPCRAIGKDGVFIQVEFGDSDDFACLCWEMASDILAELRS